MRIDGRSVDPLQWLKPRFDRFRGSEVPKVRNSPAPSEPLEPWELTDDSSHAPLGPRRLDADHRVHADRRLSRPGDGARRHAPPPADLRGRRRRSWSTTTSRKSTSSKAMRGAMRGLADGLDPDSAFLHAGSGQGGREPGHRRRRQTSASRCTRQYYLRVVSARDGSPAAKAGTPDRRLHPRHRRPSHARHVGVRRRPAAARRAGLEGERCWSSAATRPSRTRSTLTRERPTAPELTSRMANATTGYIRIVEFTADAPARDQAGRRRARQDRRDTVS